ncbi:MAG: thymidine kinase [Pseudobdellovibrionaceae bacterium]
MSFSTYKERAWIEVIVGGMFSGKTEELIKRLRRAQYARLKVQAFKPKIDNRYNEFKITSHNQTTIDSHVIAEIKEIWTHLENDTKIVGIDEAQFFSSDIVNVVQDLADRGIVVLIAGLDTDWQGKPFGPIPTLMAIAENVHKQHAVCVVCGDPASRTQRIAAVEGQVVVGSNDIYEARCRKHFKPEVDQKTSPVKFTKQMTFEEVEQ